MVDSCIRPALETSIGVMVCSQQIACHHRRLANSCCRAPGFHAEHDCQRTLLEQFARRPVALFGRIFRHCSGLLGECQIRIAGEIGQLHGAIARQGGGNAEFLL